MQLTHFNTRLFFGGNNKNKKAEKENAASEEKKEEAKDPKAAQKEQPSEAQKESENKSQQAAGAKAESAGDAEAPSSDEDVELTSQDLKKIKELIRDQDTTIDKHEASIEELNAQVKKLKEKLVYQMAENDNTVKRYRKQIEEGKQFAISKFAKELLDVRDSLELALQHCNPEKIEGIEDIEQIKEQYKNICKGQEMTSELMDKILAKFEVNQFSPLGETFDPNIHEAVFVIPKSDEHDNNSVGQVMQTGWKIGDRVLRAAKVGIVKK